MHRKNNIRTATMSALADFIALAPTAVLSDEDRRDLIAGKSLPWLRLLCQSALQTHQRLVYLLRTGEREFYDRVTLAELQTATRDTLERVIATGFAVTKRLDEEHQAKGFGPLVI